MIEKKSERTQPAERRGDWLEILHHHVWQCPRCRQAWLIISQSGGGKSNGNAAGSHVCKSCGYPLSAGEEPQGKH
jgi:hypothetical protein